MCRGMDGFPRLSAEQDTSGTMPFVSRERYNFELFTQGFLSSVKRVIVAFKVGDLGIFICTRAVASYMGILFS